MKRLSLLFLVITFVFTGCNATQSKKTTYDLEAYKTLLSPKNELAIVRNPFATYYMLTGREDILTELPSYDPDSKDVFNLDLRSTDLTQADVGDRLDDLLCATFDDVTKWPEALPSEFHPEAIMEMGKNPGLSIRELHKRGITGKGIGIAIIDQALLVDHGEYKDRLKMYEEIHCSDLYATMHGAAVASIAVGKSVGVAPEADLYYIAETHGTFDKTTSEFEWDLSWLAKSVDRIIEVNKILKPEEKIRVISISLGIGGGHFSGYKKVLASIEKAKRDGIYTVYCDSDPYTGAGRNPLRNPEDYSSYEKGLFWKDFRYSDKDLLVPMDSRCTASPTGVNDYVFYREGGLSWSTPYLAALYALACQVDTDITPEIFWDKAFETCDMIYSEENESAKIINPVRLIDAISEQRK